MSTRADEAVNRKHCGHNCSQAVACAFCDYTGLDEETLKSKTTIYRIDGEAYKDDTEAVEVLKNIHVSRSFGAFNPVKGWD